MAERSERWAIGLAVGSLGAGLGTAWLVTKVVGWEDPGTAFFSLLLLPLIVYMAVSGRIDELRGPGGFEAKFTKFATAEADAEGTLDVIDDSVQDMEGVVKGGMPSLRPRLAKLDPDKPHNLVLQVGRTHFAVHALREYLEQLSFSPTFKFIVLVDENGALVGYGPHWRIGPILRDDDLADEFVGMLNQPDISGLRSHPALHSVALPVGTKNLEALQAMADHRIEALLVVDRAGRPTGMVERDQLVPKLLLALSGRG